MAYTKQSWVNGVSPASANRMNHIEEGIAAALDKEDADATYAPIPEGTPTGSKFLRDDNTWAPPPAGGGGGFGDLGMTYDADGNVETVTEDGIVTTYTYNPDGSVDTDERGGITRQYTYDGDGNLTGIEAI